jgi:hypothetical protein
VLLMFSFGILEISLCMASLVTLEGGLKQASRYGVTSQNPSDAEIAALPAGAIPPKFNGSDNRTKMIMAILNMNTLDLIDLNAATINTSVYTSFSAAKNGEPFTDLPNFPTTGSPQNGHYDNGEPYSDLNCNGKYDGPGASSGGDDASGDAGLANAIVVYTVTYNWRILTPIVGKFLGKPDPNNAGKYIIPMKSSIVVKNEPNLSGSAFCK